MQNKNQTEVICEDWNQDQLRRIKGLDIARKSRIEKTENGWFVPSQSSSMKYLVTITEEGHPKDCNCPDFECRHQKCKHVYAVETIIYGFLDDEGNTQYIIQKKTYSQNWSAYTQAQTNEGELFMQLLSDLCSGIPNKKHEFGRPTMPMSDMVFMSALKVYSTFSLRRFMQDIRVAHEKGHISNMCSYVTVSNYMRNPEMTSILQELIELSSLPLASIEKDFAVDSSGFGTSRFARYFSFKHGRDLKYRMWIKAHLIVGTKTNIVTGVEITEERQNDCPHFKTLVERTAENFEIREVSGDKAYSSRNNYRLVDELGGKAFIPFRSNTSSKSRGCRIWNKMYHYFRFNNEEFMAHYHKRSNSETVFHMIKTKFKDNIRSKDKVSQNNEILLKVLCHNICVLIQEIHELGIKTDF